MYRVNGILCILCCVKMCNNILYYILLYFYTHYFLGGESSISGSARLHRDTASDITSMSTTQGRYCLDLLYFILAENTMPQRSTDNIHQISTVLYIMHCIVMQRLRNIYRIKLSLNALHALEDYENKLTEK